MLKKFVLSLQRLRKGSQYHAATATQGKPKSNICRTNKAAFHAIVERVFHNTVCWPEDIHDIALQFFRKGGFPSVSGCVEGTVIMLMLYTWRAVSKQTYGKHSLSVMMIFGPNTARPIRYNNLYLHIFWSRGSILTEVSVCNQ